MSAGRPFRLQSAFALIHRHAPCTQHVDHDAPKVLQSRDVLVEALNRVNDGGARKQVPVLRHQRRATACRRFHTHNRWCKVASSLGDLPRLWPILKLVLPSHHLQDALHVPLRQPRTEPISTHYVLHGAHGVQRTGATSRPECRNQVHAPHAALLALQVVVRRDTGLQQELQRRPQKQTALKLRRRNATNALVKGHRPPSRLRSLRTQQRVERRLSAVVEQHRESVVLALSPHGLDPGIRRHREDTRSFSHVPHVTLAAAELARVVQAPPLAHPDERAVEVQAVEPVGQGLVASIDAQHQAPAVRSDDGPQLVGHHGTRLVLDVERNGRPTRGSLPPRGRLCVDQRLEVRDYPANVLHHRGASAAATVGPSGADGEPYERRQHAQRSPARPLVRGEQPRVEEVLTQHRRHAREALLRSHSRPRRVVEPLRQELEQRHVLQRPVVLAPQHGHVQPPDRTVGPQHRQHDIRRRQLRRVELDQHAGQRRDVAYVLQAGDEVRPDCQQQRVQPHRALLIMPRARRHLRERVRERRHRGRDRRLRHVRPLRVPQRQRQPRALRPHDVRHHPYEEPDDAYGVHERLLPHVVEHLAHRARPLQDVEPLQPQQQQQAELLLAVGVAQLGGVAHIRQVVNSASFGRHEPAQAHVVHDAAPREVRVEPRHPEGRTAALGDAVLAEDLVQPGRCEEEPRLLDGRRVHALQHDAQQVVHCGVAQRHQRGHALAQLGQHVVGELLALLLRPAARQEEPEQRQPWALRIRVVASDQVEHLHRPRRLRQVAPRRRRVVAERAVEHLLLCPAVYLRLLARRRSVPSHCVLRADCLEVPADDARRQLQAAQVCDGIHRPTVGASLVTC
ncbi:uncharacterized protein BcabD6B2_31080 [Babesia caballi]|uniref:Uncharacterized protein n=1 Tax=Babesia caballi TaxID=5871 RepID=A0AAV4LU31_BABCB|nr:hypothetical protein BcabD6B2_31080 [Babesia caballi]